MAGNVAGMPACLNRPPGSGRGGFSSRAASEKMTAAARRAPESQGTRMKAAQMFDLSGRVALVTGASSGLGRRFAQVLAANGATVALVARRADRLAELKMLIDYEGGRAIAVEADVLDRDAMMATFDAVEQAFGPVTILVNNAGIAHAGRALDLAEDAWRRVLATDLD